MPNEFKIKNGLLVSGSITGVTESGAENSAKMASTSWTRTYVTSLGYLTGVTSAQVTSALGFTPYDATNPSGYITASALSSYLPLAGGTLTGTGATQLVLLNSSSNVRTSFGSGSTNTNLWSSGGFDLRINYPTNVNSSFFIDTFGQVGINTNLPSYRLDVNGSGRFTGILYGANANFSSSVTASSFVKSSGTAAQFLKADGSVDSTAYTPTSRAITINGTTFDLSADRTYTIAPSASARNEQTFTATAGQTTFTIVGGYVVGLVDVFVNGVKYAPADYTASNGSTVVLGVAALVGDIVSIVNYTSTIAVLPTSRDVIDYTATSAQTTFTVSGGYVVGLLDVYSNGVKLTPSEVTATNGTTFVLTFAAVTGDQIQAIRYNASVTGISGSGTANYIPRFSASGTISNSYLFQDSFGVTVDTATNNTSLTVISTDTAYLNVKGGSNYGLLQADYYGMLLHTQNGITGNDLFYYDWAGKYLSLGTNGLERIRITSAGNVGIGTITPQTYGFFVVNNTANSTGVSTVIRNQTDVGGDNTRYAGLDFMIGSDNGTASIRAYRTSSATDYSTALTFWTKGTGANATIPTERMRITSAGNVGIGTTAPAGGISGTEAALEISNSNVGVLAITSLAASGKKYQIYSSNDGGLYFRDGTSASQRLIITSSGNVGISTTSPSGRLTVSSDQSSNNQLINIVGTQTGFAQEWGFGFPASSRDLRLYDYTLGQTRLTFQKGGNLIHYAYTVGEGILWNYTGGATYGLYNAGNGTFVLTNSGVANVGSFNMSTGAYTALSDRNKKKDFEVSQIGLKEVLQLKPTLYRMKTDDTEGTKELGFIAQEVRDLIPNAYVDNGDFIGLNYNPIVVALTKAVQELKAELDLLKNQ